MASIKARLLTGVASVTLLDASAAIAADMRVPMPVKAQVAPAPALSWTGFYVGGHAGYSWGAVDGDTVHNAIVAGSSFFAVAPGTVLFSIDRALKPNGALGGFQAGYNFQSARIVYGIEADFSWTGERDSFDFSGRKTAFNAEDFVYQETLSAKLRYMGTVRGRLGYAFDQLLPYVTGGFAWGRVQMDFNWALAQFPTGCPGCTAFPSVSFANSQAQTLFGWTLGAGFEYAFAPHWSAKAEYLHVDLGSQTFFNDPQGTAAFGLRDEIVRLGLNYRL